MRRLTYTTEQLAEELNTNRNLISILREEGAITGIKKGNGYIYTCSEVDQFLNDWVGMDMSNRETIRESMIEIERRKRNGRRKS